MPLENTVYWLHCSFQKFPQFSLIGFGKAHRSYYLYLSIIKKPHFFSILEFRKEKKKDKLFSSKIELLLPDEWRETKSNIWKLERLLFGRQNIMASKHWGKLNVALKLWQRYNIYLYFVMQGQARWHTPRISIQQTASNLEVINLQALVPADPQGWSYLKVKLLN